jgi:hypothetical protein
MEFFIIKDKKQRGPYTLEQLAEMGITSDTPVWHEGLGPWKPAWQVEELKDLLAGKAAQQPTPPPVPPQEWADDSTETQPGGEENAAGKDGKRHRRRAVKWLAAAAVVFFILLITCPGEERHRQTVVDEIVEAAQREVPWQSGDDTPLGSFSGTIGNLIVSRFADAVVGQFMSVDNYVIFSVGTIRYGGETKTISFGILGHVFTFDADDIGKAVDKEQPAPDTMAI